MEESSGFYVLAPTSTRDLALAWTIQTRNPVITCCGQSQPGFSMPHPFPVVGGRSTRHGGAKFSQLPSQCGEVRTQPKSMVWKHTASHCEDGLNKMGQVSTRTASSFFFNKFIYLFIFGCVRCSLLRTGFLSLRRMGATLCCSVWASHCGGLSLLQSTGSRRVGFSSCGSRALERRLSSCAARA